MSNYTESNLRKDYKNYYDGKEVEDTRTFPEKNTFSKDMKEHHQKMKKLKELMLSKNEKTAADADRMMWFMKQPSQIFSNIIYSYYKAHNDLTNPGRTELQFSVGRYADIKLHKRHLRLPKLAHIMKFFMENPEKFETTARFMPNMKIYFFDFSLSRKGHNAYDVTDGEIFAQFEDNDTESPVMFEKFLKFIYKRYGYKEDKSFGVVDSTVRGIPKDK